MDDDYEQPTTFTGRNDSDSSQNGIVDVDALIAYLRNVLQVLLGASSADLTGSIFSDSSDTRSRLVSFAVDANASVLFAAKSVSLDESGQDGSQYRYSIQPDIAPSPSLVSLMAIIKRPSPLDLMLPIESQLQIVNLPSTTPIRYGRDTEASPYETLYSFIHLAIAPYFDAYTRGKGATGAADSMLAKASDSKTGVPATKKRLAELELSLLHLQQNNEIPELSLTFHPVIQQALTKAAAINTTPTIDDISIELLSDTKFLNALQSNVNSWIKSIQSITKMTRDRASGTATQEINFWISLEAVLEDIDRQLQLDGVNLTMDVLRYAKRFHATISFMADTELKESLELVKKYNILMNEFPIDDLLSAPTLQRLKESVVQIFSHLNKRIRLSPYPIQRALHLVEAISADLDSQFRSLINGRRLMHLEYPDFERVIEVAEDVFATWDTQIKEFTNVAREVTRRRAEKFIPIRFNAKHAGTQERLLYLKSFRSAHEQLLATVSTVLGPQKLHSVEGGAVETNETDADDVVEELIEGYAALRDVDVLDISPEGTEIWNAAERVFNQRTSRIEDSIIANLRNCLATAKTANEMFRVFSRFNALFIRPKIRGAIQEYQTQLIDNVKTDIQSLHNRFIEQYSNSDACRMAVLRDIPPVSGAIIWVRQIERQLNMYMKRVEDVLGKGWELYSEGEKLYNESNTFKKKLESKSIFDSWLRDMTERKLSVGGRLFNIIRNRAANNRLEVVINFDPQVIGLFKEVRNLTYLKFQVPHAISSVSKEAKRIYPYAMGLSDTLHVYTQTGVLIEKLGDAAVLMSEYINLVQEWIRVGNTYTWEAFVRSTYDMKIPGTNGAHENKQLQFFRDITMAVSELERKAKILDETDEQIEEVLDNLLACDYNHAVFSKLIANIQSLIDKLNLENFSNLKHFVFKLNFRIRQILLSRMRYATADWIAQFKAAEMNNTGVSTDHRGVVITLEVIIKNQTIALLPSLNYARSVWYSQFQECIATVCKLSRLNSSRYELVYDVSSIQTDDELFSELPSKSPGSLLDAYNVIETKLDEVRAYTSKWLQFQSLWDLQPEKVYAVLNDDVNKWANILQEIRRVRMTFDTAETYRNFGNIVVDYEQVQTRINAKYDTWQHDILLRFADILNTKIQDMHSDLEKTRKELEIQTLDMSSIRRAVNFVTFIQSASAKVEPFAASIESSKIGQIALSRNRYQFPADYIFSDQIDGEWSAFLEILARKRKVVDDKLYDLRSKVQAEHKLVTDQVNRAVDAWNEEKPVAGTTAPDAALAVLEKFDKQLSNLKTEQELVSHATKALDIELQSANTLELTLQEIQDFKSVWSALSSVWRALNDLRETPWVSFVPRRVKQSIDELMTTTKEMPSRIRQYSSFEHIQDILRQLLQTHSMITELKSEVMRERHWEKLFKTLQPKQIFHLGSVTLGDVWDLDLLHNENVIRDILAQARGEMVLEDFLKQVRETWSTYFLNLVNYQNKCRLIRDWDELFQKCAEHMSSLAAMHHSPYYKQFEDETLSWEDKLGRLNMLFDSWIDVQRQWVYLEGVFSGNAEIKSLLPVESSRFQNVNAEFFALMRKVVKSPNVLDVLAIPGAQVTLTRLADLLSTVQKALGEYLERERMQFPRYYFVGDEDLLEIIGNAKDTVRIQKHFKKMFAGIAGIVFDDENSTITAVTSREGEVVNLKQSISLIKTPKVNEWLKLLEMSTQETLAMNLADAIAEYEKALNLKTLTLEQFTTWIQKYPAQVVILASQVVWTATTEKCLGTDIANLPSLFANKARLLDLLASAVLQEIGRIDRKKCEGLITELVHQRNVIQNLISESASSKNDFGWLSTMKFVYTDDQEPIDRVQVQIGTASFKYGFEYIGVPDKLVQTKLTDKCFMALTGALEQSLGGSPFGPAGTGKTETVKALGAQLGRFVLVFNCDDTFNFQSMSRIFLGICQVGAWGCFDEFNRLDERILSAVSTQIQSIQLGLQDLKRNQQEQIKLIGKQLTLNEDTGIFITMNPGYAGRSNLPDNLKKLFRAFSMSRPDKELITEVVLYSQGFIDAKKLSLKIVPFFDTLANRLSQQLHYDFGLRALKSVLATSGDLKRRQFLQQTETVKRTESEIILQSLRETISPKLVGKDLQLFLDIEGAMFQGVKYVAEDLTELQKGLVAEANAEGLMTSNVWLTKALQLYQIQTISHGLMMVGESGSGKSAVWKTLLKALQQLEGRESVSYVIDSKVMSKESLFGSVDLTTREWTDGLFTSILRKINEDFRGESLKRHWIVFDCDVDPEWAENLNSVLDDNRILTLPNGERLSLPSNVRILLETDSMKHATLATVSRCGIVWFESDVVSTTMLVQSHLNSIRINGFEENEDGFVTDATGDDSKNQKETASVVTQFEKLFLTSFWLDDVICDAKRYSHIMTFSRVRAVHTLISLCNTTMREIVEYNLEHPDFALTKDQRETYLLQKVLLDVIWSCAGDCPLREREELANYVCQLSIFSALDMPGNDSILNYTTSLPLGNWIAWKSQVPRIHMDPQMVTATDVVIPTIDTARHEALLHACLQEKRCMILCGPPGSGKTMTLFNTLRKFANVEIAGLNFSSATSPELVIKTFEQYCDYHKTHSGLMLTPKQVGRRLVVFCDEINLPVADKYGTQHAISFLRQLVEYNGFWRLSDRTWVELDHIQFVGACNPPTDAGRTELTQRFLRHSSLVMIDYPGDTSLHQIYGSFNAAILKSVPSLRGYGDALTSAMVELYTSSQQRFTTAQQSHYVYSPRELTRWVRGIHETIQPLSTLNLEGLVRIWAHEATRLFSDRLVTEEERQETDNEIRRVARRHFLNINEHEALQRPILFSKWLTKNYMPVKLDKIREFTHARLRTFCEEELDVPLVLFDDAIDHILRIDRVFRMPQGHMILIGTSGSGKSTLTRFVAWMNGLRIFQINAHKKYTGVDFDEDLREVLRSTGCRGQKVCFILDESNVLQSGFLERMNTLLANAEIPGLFEGEDYTGLLSACRDGARQQGLMLDSQDELYNWFKSQVVRNLHVVFTMNPPREGLSAKAATSPALFNRCVLNWMGDWSASTLFQVGTELTHGLDLDASYSAPEQGDVDFTGTTWPPSHRQAIVSSMVHIHTAMQRFNDRIEAQSRKVNFTTPQHFLDLVAQFERTFNNKREELEDQQRHLNVGLEKLQDTVERVRHMRTGLTEKQEQLRVKSALANEKLQQMVVDQNETEQRRAKSVSVQAELAIREQEIAERQKTVMDDLAQAEPAVQVAKESVSNIKKQHLSEVRSMANPPEAVKMAMEAVCTLLGHKVDNWRAVQSVIRRDDFISSIVNFNTETQMPRSLRNKVQAEYLSRPNFNFETVNRASKACGPLTLWIEAQVNYSLMLEKIGPLREEVALLTAGAEETRAQVEQMTTVISELEESIVRYKEEYANLISEVQEIKAEMAKIEFKVDRSVRLLGNLAAERERWRHESISFEEQSGSLAGDALLAAAMLVYGGFFDQQYRMLMQREWQGCLLRWRIAFKDYVPVSEYMSNMTQRAIWNNNGLPVGELYIENALMLQKYNRYPLIIDPTGRTIEFLRKQHKSLIVTSFLDDAFVKQLESALRFGSPLLVTDAEHFDPILNHVLNKEYQQVGGRVLIQLGRQAIDFSSSFKLFLITRDAGATFSPDLCSRTTVVNFTVTRSNLLAQSLDEVLKVLRPDIDRKRSNLSKLRTEFMLHLRELEQKLLQALNASEGNILDDDHVVETLENLKVQAEDVAEKMAETEGVMGKIDEMAEQYHLVAETSSTIFAILELLPKLDRFYQFSLDFLQTGFVAVLASAGDLKDLELESRVKEIVMRLYAEIYRRTVVGIKHMHGMMLATMFAYSMLKKCDITAIEDLFNHEQQKVDLSSDGYEISLLVEHVRKSAFFTGYDIDDTESMMKFLATEDDDVDAEFVRIMLMRLTRSKHYVTRTRAFVERAFADKFTTDVSVDLQRVVDNEITVTVPVCVCCVPGFDASYKVEQLAKEKGSRFMSVALGSGESITAAERAVAECAENGSWVVLKNVHLMPEWLDVFVKSMSGLRAASSFRLFLCMETTTAIPVSLLQTSRVLLFEPLPGVKACVSDAFMSIPHAEVEKDPVERARAYFAFAWFHSVVLERLRYGVAGWTKAYDFTDADFDFGVRVVDKLVSAVARGRTNLAPSDMPWDTIRRMMCDIVYGGKMDSPRDVATLTEFGTKVFNSKIYDEEYELGKGLRVPAGARRDAIVEWIDELSAQDNVEWLGLPADAVRM
ncbi:dynein heavy chain, N-terminal region 1-domain-containing protein [Lipomyces arxii]|uniref:dynein heavy chain, N-terminal region 1-domain-containing protein n=1 Tax=Lipomyces arxii TaxID=56418 RepID=UPI0034CE6DEB